MVAVQAGLLDALGIEELAAVAGGSMGGMQVLQWAVHHAHRVRRAIVLASCARLTAQALAFNEVGRQAIMGDPRWREGRYAPHDPRRITRWRATYAIRPPASCAASTPTPICTSRGR
jgi:homoserine O-acetyltransferase